MSWYVNIGMSTILLILTITVGCDVSDWEYEYNYFVKIDAVSDDPYQIMLPLPDLTSNKIESKINPKHLDDFVTGIKIQEDQCSYEIIEHEDILFLQIKGDSSAIIMSSFKLWDVNLTVSVANRDNRHAWMYSDNSGIGVTIHSRRVRKTEEKETWSLFYSVIADTTNELTRFTKKNWNASPKESACILLEKGWHPYRVTEGEMEIQ